MIAEKNGESSDIDVTMENAVEEETKSEVEEPEVKESETEEPLDTISSENEDGIKVYTDDWLEFEYPENWEFSEKKGEDGSVLTFSDNLSEQNCGFEVKTGEAWRIDFSRMGEDYILYYMQYPDMEIVELSQTFVGGYEAQKLVFTYLKEDVEYTVEKYYVIVGYVGREFSGEYVTEEKERAEEIEAIISSVKFLESDVDDTDATEVSTESGATQELYKCKSIEYEEGSPERNLGIESLDLYIDEARWREGTDDGSNYALKVVTTDGEEIEVIPLQFFQLTTFDIASYVYEEKYYVVVDALSSAGYQITEYVFDAEKKEFSEKEIYSVSNINCLKKAEKVQWP